MSLLIGGKKVQVPGVNILGPGEHALSKLDPRDYRLRPKGMWVRQLIIHTTGGRWPQHIIDAPGKGGEDENISKYWSRDPKSSGAHIIVDTDGSVLCLCDVATIEAYHATTSNPFSIGLEMCQRKDGGLHRITLENTVRIAMFLCSYHECDQLFIPFQIPGHKYARRPIERMRLHGGPDMAGVFGHRDNAWAFPWQLTPEQLKKYPDGYASRGQGDPGDVIFQMLATAGAESYDFDLGADRVAWRRRQQRLNARGARLTVDGIPGPATRRAMRAVNAMTGSAVDALSSS